MKFNYSFKIQYVFVLILAASLNLLGVIMVRSASDMNSVIVQRQIIGSVAGFILCLFVSFFDYKRLFKYAALFYIVINVMLLSVILYGVVRGGAGRWIELPVVGRIQPSEFAKAGLILCFAAYFDRHSGDLNTFRNILKAFIMAGIPALLIFLEPNLSTTIILFVIFFAMLCVSGLSIRLIAIFCSVGAAFTALMYYLFSTDKYEAIPFIKDYQKKRILSFLDPTSDPDSWRQTQNSIMAIGSGGFFGKGVNNTDINSVKAGNFLIEEETDFIFAVIGEELGFRGCLIILILYFLLIVVILYIGGKSEDTGGCAICVGVATWIAFQTFTNVAVCTGLFPNTGVTLPFFSRGVSSIAAIYVGLGMVLNVCLKEKR